MAGFVPALKVLLKPQLSFVEEKEPVACDNCLLPVKQAKTYYRPAGIFSTNWV
jgi:hypothetical protein